MLWIHHRLQPVTIVAVNTISRCFGATHVHAARHACLARNYTVASSHFHGRFSRLFRATIVCDTLTFTSTRDTLTSQTVVPVIKVEGASNMLNSILGATYSIGYLDTGHGQLWSAPEVAIANQRGQVLTASEADIGSAATDVAGVGIPSAVTESWANVSLGNANVDDAWPLVQFSYLYLDVDLSSLGQSGALIRAFAEYVAPPPFVNSDSVLFCFIVFYSFLLASLVVYAAPPPFVDSDVIERMLPIRATCAVRFLHGAFVLL